MAKAKAKQKKTAKKVPVKKAKVLKSKEKKPKAGAPVAKASKKSATAKSQPTAAKVKTRGSTPPVAKPAKVGKKESKASGKPSKDSRSKKEELDIFDDDGDGTESEELLEYEEELDLSEEEEAEDLDSDDGSDSVEVEGSVLAVTPESEEDIILTDAEGNRYCRAKDCDQIAMVDGYCRYHYLLYWKKIQIRKEILQDGKLEKYVEDLTSRYPDKFLEMLRKDLRTAKDFMAAIAELEIDESAGENEFEEDAQTFIDEVRGISDTSASMDDDEY